MSPPADEAGRLSRSYRPAVTGDDSRPSNGLITTPNQRAQRAPHPVQGPLCKGTQPASAPEMRPPGDIGLAVREPVQTQRDARMPVLISTCEPASPGRSQRLDSE